MTDSNPVRLLLVDDEAALREPLAEYLSRQGFAVAQAASAAATASMRVLTSSTSRRALTSGIMISGTTGAPLWLASMVASKMARACIS